jgi:hypothetical protein
VDLNLKLLALETNTLIVDGQVQLDLTGSG